MLSTRVLQFSRASRALAGLGAPNSLPRAHRLRTTTGITGLAVHPSPLPALAGIYSSTLSLLKALPENSVYRQSAEAITQHRLAIVQKHSSTPNAAGASESANEDVIQAIEQELDSGLIEEVIQQAQHEVSLAAKMIEWKSHEPLEHPPPAGQWQYFSMEEEAGEGQESGNKV
ncbi:hypothetical protein K437DRAFT_251224 [Tilletiaria anomala UBC 951]|uniref:NADH2 dehydrogenase n=1 Tax=Tilletiaria anomala (strain ATCC 24038 / CBS 436.72 / UBC 951) TaxID=1037660 RepID=A0A066V9Z4_TILAU|nr:uncharacterized protein K437DRAFT_251224 [Tilletiaria anomala UBC 951]KDN38572.1 hypothetical protein K437DRAFT_251224 [Tilletiaria anomala UBC 951]